MGRYTVSAGTLRIGPLASTRMACPPAMMEQEATLTATFDRPSSYRITGETLTLFDGDKELAHFEARTFK
jgi:putative lipoprotein